MSDIMKGSIWNPTEANQVAFTEAQLVELE